MIFYLYSPSHFERWDYRNPMGAGIGGSETAHIEVAERLAKRGHKVISYTPLPNDIKRGEKYNGVLWYDLKDAKFYKDGIWIIYRSPKTFDKFSKDHPGQKVWLVMQDTVYPDLTEERALKCNVYFALCTTHVNVTKNDHPEIADRVGLSQNGIRTQVIRNLEPEVRDPHRMMYASSPDRGLMNLLKMFPEIKAKEPKASLHVFYGFDNIEKVVDPNSPIDELGSTVNDFKRKLKQEGVYWHGRTGQMELYKEWLKTGVWAYPTRFSETSCITSMEAQALGAMPVTNPFWALKDNIMSGTLIDGDPSFNGLTRGRYIDEIVYWMNNATDGIRERMITQAQARFDWDKVVEQYERFAKL
jgi:protein O-GlcNAc transferase